MINTGKESIFINSVPRDILRREISNCLLLCTMKWKGRGNTAPMDDIVQWYKKGMVEISFYS